MPGLSPRLWREALPVAQIWAMVSKTIYLKGGGWTCPCIAKGRSTNRLYGSVERQKYSPHALSAFANFNRNMLELLYLPVCAIEGVTTSVFVMRNNY